MRRVLAIDVKAAAAALVKLPEDERGRMCELWIHQADWAHKYMKVNGKPHAVWGNGSLLDAMHIRDFDVFDFGNPEHCSAMETVLGCLVAHKCVKRINRSRN